MSEGLLPPYLHNTEPLETEDIPLQLALITMEVASLREKLARLSQALTEAGQMINPDLFPDGNFDVR